MDKTAPWNSLRNVVLGLALVGGGMAGFATRYCINAPRTAQWRREQYAASVEQAANGGRTIEASPTAVQ